MVNKKLCGTYFYGNEASLYAREQGYLDYATLAKAFNAVMNNNIISATSEIGYWEQVNGIIDNSEEVEELKQQLEDIEWQQKELILQDKEETEEYTKLEEKYTELEERIEELEEENDNREIFQYFIISNSGAEILKEWTSEIVFYNETLDMYVWGVTHCGTGWDYVLTDIELNSK